MSREDQNIVSEFMAHIADKQFPCIAAKAALAERQIEVYVADHLACPHDDENILQFLYQFIDTYRNGKELYFSAAVIFKGPSSCDEDTFDKLLWSRLQAISDLDAKNYSWDSRVDCDVQSSKFSFSIKEEALYVIGMHGGSSRPARTFQYPALVFNPHQQFEKLRALNKYQPMSHAVRQRDLKLAGSTNPMLTDFGETSEVFQYSGKQYDSTWKCPFTSRHKSNQHNSTT